MAHLLIVQNVNLKKNKISIKQPKGELGKILNSISQFTKINIEDIKSRSRKREIADARALYCSFCYEYSNKSLAKIGTEVNLNHATVIANNKKRKDVLSKEYEKFKTYIKNSGHKLIYSDRVNLKTI